MLFHWWFIMKLYNVVQIWAGLFVCKQVTVCPGHIWTTLYIFSVVSYEMTLVLILWLTTANMSTFKFTKSVKQWILFLRVLTIRRVDMVKSLSWLRYGMDVWGIVIHFEESWLIFWQEPSEALGEGEGGNIQPLIRQVLGVFSSIRDTAHAFSSNVEFQNEWSCVSAYPYTLLCA
jgi:hypothetical protein